jgi:transposase
MKPKQYRVTLSDEERAALLKVVKTGKHSAQKRIRANILLELDESQKTPKNQSEIADALKTSTVTIYKVSKQYCEKGIDGVLARKKRTTPPTAPLLTGEDEARVIQLACSKAPEGRSRWTLRLLEEKIVELEICPPVSDNTIGRLLKKHHLSLT